MFRELTISHIDVTKEAFQEFLTKEFDYFSVFINYLPLCKERKNVLCNIDFPFGNTSSLSRKKEVELALKAGAAGVNVVIPHSLIYLGSKTAASNIKDIRKMCEDESKIFRVAIENRLYPNIDFIVKVLKNLDISEVILSTGLVAPDFSEEVMLANTLKQDHQIESIISVKTAEELAEAERLSLYGARTRNPRCIP